MSIRINLVAAAVTLGLATLSGQGAATAESWCNGAVHHVRGSSVQCYYLPTVSNGRVTGLREQINWHSNRSAGGAVIGSSTAHMPCRFLPTVVNGRVVGSHQVCG
jgi:hypothetical protein